MRFSEHTNKKTFGVSQQNPASGITSKSLYKISGTD
jgi:hypothetical protein